MIRIATFLLFCFLATTAHASARVPTKAQLQGLLDSWSFQKRKVPEGVWQAKTAPKALKSGSLLKDVVLEKPKANAKGGATVTAHVLKGQPQQVVFEKATAGAAPKDAHRYFGPVRTDIAPK